MSAVIDWIVLLTTVFLIYTLIIRGQFSLKSLIKICLVILLLLMLYMENYRFFLISFLIYLLFLYSRQSWEKWIWFLGALILLLLGKIEFLVVYILLEVLLWRANRNDWLLKTLYGLSSVVLTVVVGDLLNKQFSLFLFWQVIILLKAISSGKRYWYEYLWLCSIRIIVMFLANHLGSRVPLDLVVIPLGLIFTSLPLIIGEDDFNLENKSFLPEQLVLGYMLLGTVVLASAAALFFKQPYLFVNMDLKQLTLLVCVVSLGVCLKELLVNWIWCYERKSKLLLRFFSISFWGAVFVFMFFLVAMKIIEFSGFLFCSLIAELVIMIILFIVVNKNIKESPLIYKAEVQFPFNVFSYENIYPLISKYMVGIATVTAILKKSFLQAIISVVLTGVVIGYAAKIIW